MDCWLRPLTPLVPVLPAPDPADSAGTVRFTPTPEEHPMQPTITAKNIRSRVGDIVDATTAEYPDMDYDEAVESAEGIREDVRTAIASGALDPDEAVAIAREAVRLDSIDLDLLIEGQPV